MEKILNSIEELYKLITDTLPEGYVECVSKSDYDVLGSTKVYGSYINQSICYFIITDSISHTKVKIEYCKKGMPIIRDGRIYKYV